MTKKTTLLTATIIFAIIGLITSTFSYSNASTESSTFYVPSWVQNVAGFWSNGDVSDDEFVNAMTFLVDEGIMDLPNVVSPAEAQTITSSLEDMNQRLEKIETQTKTAGETSAPTPLSEDELTSSDDICPASKVQHWNKIIFTYFGTLESDKGFPDIIKERTYEIIVQGHPGEIIDLNQLVFDRLTGMGYIGYMPDPNGIKIVDVGYGIICAYDSNPSVPSDKK